MAPRKYGDRYAEREAAGIFAVYLIRRAPGAYRPMTGSQAASSFVVVAATAAPSPRRCNLPSRSP